MSTTSSGKRKRAAGKFYAVRKGRTPGIYHSWPDCQQQTDRFRNPEFKSFPTLDAAEAFMKEGKRDASAPISLRGDLSESCSLPADIGSKVGIHAAKKQKKENGLPIVANGDTKWEPGLGPLPPDAQDGFDPTLKLDADTGGIRYKTDQEMSATKLQPTGEFSGPIVVYTDGSSLGNGGVGAVGGVGVYFGPNDKRNVSEALRGNRQTNQRAELTAVARALDHIPIDREALIWTDSSYSIKCLTEWSDNWIRRNWKTSGGKDVENRDLIEPILARMAERKLCKAETHLKWLKGHANHPGNVAADRLAVNGSRTSTPEMRSGDGRDFSVTLRTPTPKPSTAMHKFATAGARDITPGRRVVLQDSPKRANDDADEEELEQIFRDLADEQPASAYIDDHIT